jgi:hypothetical protein
MSESSLRPLPELLPPLFVSWFRPELAERLSESPLREAFLIELSLSDWPAFLVSLSSSCDPYICDSSSISDEFPPERSFPDCPAFLVSLSCCVAKLCVYSSISDELRPELLLPDCAFIDWSLRPDWADLWLFSFSEFRPEFWLLLVSIKYCFKMVNNFCF